MSEPEVIEAEIVPDDVSIDEIREEEDVRAIVTTRSHAMALGIDALVQIDPDKAIKVFEAREKVLTSLRKVSIRATRPIDWTLAKDQDGREVASLRKSGASILRKYYGISIFNILPVDPKTGAAMVQMRETTDGWVAEIWGSGRSAVTGEEVYDVRGQRMKGERFTGRGTESDLMEAARTNLENKIVRILTGTSAMPIEELEEAWKGTGKNSADCYRGPGYGSSGSRSSRGSSGQAPRGGAGASGGGGSRQQASSSSTTTGAKTTPTKLSPKQRGLLFAQAKECIAESIEPPMTEAEYRAVMKEILAKLGFESSKDITQDKFDGVLTAIAEWKPEQ